ncbi:MAG: acyl carrier protein [Nitrospirae bacterium]|nr:acyl carrier protein [Nitrospirota bacterium]MBU6481105.1 acyl carrier protein [Nitrospirota bacterium]MDE3049081.1 acyl carrier protein [Nitrospirota bacterium]
MNIPLTSDEIRQTVLRLLGEVAPEADLTALKPGVGFRDQLDIDSMDFLNFVILIHKTFGLEIPEADYPKYATLNGCVEQLSDKRAT